MLCKSKSLVTIVTTKWSLISVNHLMTMKIFKKGESTATCLTLMWSGFISYKLKSIFIQSLKFGLVGSRIDYSQ